MTRSTRKLFIKSFGCQMNVYDAQRLSDALEADGFAAADRPEDADLIVLNTCHIREKAAEKVYSELGRVREDARERGVRPIVAVTGCVAQAEGAEILDRASNVDLVVGPQSYHRIGALLREVEAGRRMVETELPTAEKFTALPLPKPERTAARGVTAFLTVQEGCDKFCSFCVVPYTRGAEYSRPVEQVLAEARRLADGGVRELTLLGQNVNAYAGAGPDGRDWSLARLLERLAELPGITRLRYTTSHPRDMGEDLVAMHRDLPALMPYLHLPVQSGSDRILKAMNRKHTAADYLRLVEKLRAARPDLALSSDFIVGFPGETDADFRATLELAEEVSYAGAFSFKYSQRPGTPAADAELQVSEPLKAERLAILQDLLRAQTAEFNERTVGQMLDVLVDKPGRHAGQLGGRSPYLQAVHFSASGIAIGSTVRLRIMGAGPNSLVGELAGAPAIPAEAAA